MKTDLLVDASVVFKWVIPEPDSDAAIALFDRDDLELSVLDLAQIEAANAAWVAFKRGRITQQELDTAISDLETLPLNIVAARSRLRSAVSLSVKYGIAVYDALFVAAAGAGRGTTADDKLLRALGADFPNIVSLAAA